MVFDSILNKENNILPVLPYLELLHNLFLTEAWEGLKAQKILQV